MKDFNLKYTFFVIFLYLLIETSGYIIPNPKFELSSRNSILIKIPDEKCLRRVLFHGALNQKIKFGDNTIDYTGEMLKTNNKEWILEIKNNFDVSDILYYWIYAQCNQDNYWAVNKFEFKSLQQINCPETITTITNSKKQICKGQTIFEETFDKYDRTKWQREIKFNGYDGEFVLYEDMPQNLYVENGNLHIVPTLTTKTHYNKILGPNINLNIRCTETEQTNYFCQRNSKYRILPPITSAKIRTKESFSFRYGLIEVRAKLPRGDWIFPQIFLDPLKNLYANESNFEYLAGQMRIAFIRGNVVLRNTKNNKYYSGSVLSGGIRLHDCNEKYMATNIRVEHLGNDFHKYSILWTDTEIKLYIDDQMYGTIDNSFSKVLPKNLMRSSNMEPFTEPFYITLGVGVGGYMNFPDDTRTLQNMKKPWRNDEPNAEMKFWFAYDKWIQTWNDNNNHLIVDYVKVSAV